MKKIYLLLIAATTLGLLFATVLVFGEAPRASALSGSQFSEGHIIDDSIFYDSNSMTATQIQTFLNSKVPTCDTNGTQMYTSTETRAQYGTSVGYPPPYICLKNYTQSTPAEAAVSGICGYLPARSNQTAANIIAQVSAACGISPKVILVTLQKEEGLVADDWPFPSQYKIAMGYGCPDTAACDSQYYGFFNQVYDAAMQFELYRANPTNYNYVAGQYNSILYSPTISCGSSSVYIQNQATAGLYNYTPYQPNAAALNNLDGAGDSCSSYGNRNFWRYFTEWFGDTTESKAFKTSGSSTVYLRAAGYKFTVPNMALLQDYGISPGSIQTISQTSANAIPSPDASTGLSTSLSYLVKSPSDTDQDGSTVYFVSVGKKYAIKDMQQFNDFGFNAANISYLPLSLIEYITGTDQLSNYIQMPTNLVFQVSGAQKRPIFQQKTFYSLDSSGIVSPVSYAAAGRIPAGDPLTNTGIFIRPTSQAAIYLYTSTSNYYVFPTYDTYSCWNNSLGGTLPYVDLAKKPEI